LNQKATGNNQTKEKLKISLLFNNEKSTLETEKFSKKINHQKILFKKNKNPIKTEPFQNFPLSQRKLHL